MISSKTYRPFWTPDHASNECVNCRSKFTAVIRRHHCRSCGNIFCNECTDRKQTLPHLHYNKPVRICSSCDDLVKYLKLSQSNQISEKIESSKGFCQATTDAESKKMIVKCYLDTFYFLISDNITNNSNNNENKTYIPINKVIFRYMSRAIANLSINEYFRSDLIEANLLQPLVNYLLYQFKDPFSNINQAQLQSPSVHQVPESEDEQIESLANILKSFENLANVEHQIVKQELGEKCLLKMVDLLKLPFNFHIKNSISIVLLNLTKNSLTREYIIQYNAIQSFLMNSLGDENQETSSESLEILSRVPKYHKKVIDSGALPPLILMLNSPNDRVIQHTTLALANLSLNQENQAAMGKVGCINPLIKIITEKNYFDTKILIYTLTALFNLSSHKSNCVQLVQHDFIESLTKIVTLNYNNQTHELLKISLKILCNLSNEKEGKSLIKKNQSMMSALRIMIHTTNKLQSQASIIFNNCEPPLPNTTL